MALTMSARNSDRDGAGRDGGTAAVFAVFEDHHFGRWDTESLGGLEINLGMRLSMCDVFRGKNRRESQLISEYTQDMLDERAAAASGDGLGYGALFQGRQEFDEAGHGRKALAEDAGEYFVGFRK